MYYDNYIQEEVRKGRTEADVIAELGDPWVIARTIIDSVENQKEIRSQRQTYQSDYEDMERTVMTMGKMFMYFTWKVGRKYY